MGSFGLDAQTLADRGASKANRRHEEGPAAQGLREMELAGLEPATSWVRSRHSPN